MRTPYRYVYILLGALLALPSCAPQPEGQQSEPGRLTAVPFNAVKMEDSFWKPRIETNRTVTIPANFQIKSPPLDPLRAMPESFEDIVATLSRLQSEDPSSPAIIREIEPVEPEDIPEPFRSLLVHEKDMTGTLAGYWGLPIILRPLTVRRKGNVLYRQVVLTAGPDRIPVEAGAIKIYLDRFPAEALPEITRNRKPLGSILVEHGISYVSTPQGYFQTTASPFLKDAFADAREQTLYGRCNRLTNPADDPLADVVEILPAIRQS